MSDLLHEAQTALKEQLQEGATLGKEALSSNAWLYPIKGLLYFGSHPSLYTSVLPVIWKSILLSIGVLAGMFIVTYLPQAAFCALFSGPLGFVAAVPLVLTESFLVITFFAKIFLMGQIGDDLFDAVLLQKGHQQLVTQGRNVGKGSSGAKKLGKSVIKPLQRFSKSGLIRYIVSLPLNAIPILGTALFLLYNGMKAGPGYHARYFQFKQMGKEDQQKFVDKRRGSYTAFGVISLALELIPIVGLVLSFTSTVGAALWASDLESGLKPSTGVTEILQQESKVEL